MPEGTSVLSEHEWVYTALEQVTTLGCTSITGIDQSADSWERKAGTALWAECESTIATRSTPAKGPDVSKRQ